MACATTADQPTFAEDLDGDGDILAANPMILNFSCTVCIPWTSAVAFCTRVSSRM